MIRNFTVCYKYFCLTGVSNLDSRISNRRFASIMSSIKIGTHDGMFHCDEALACFMLKLLPRYKDATIVRSRDPKVLDTCDIVVDVGGKYDPSIHRYDHHMRDFNESVSTIIKKPGYDWTIKLSSAGLIYCHFGLEIVKEVIKEDIGDANIECVYKKVYDILIKEVDAVDNGVPICEGQPRYIIHTGLSSRVQRLNPQWNSPPMDIDAQFQKAIELTGTEFIESIEYFSNVWLPARKIVEEAVAKRFEVDESGEIIVLSQIAPWIQHLFDIEKEKDIEPSIKYAIFDSEDGSYRVRAVPVAPESFVCRMFLPESWGGLRDDELVKISGIENTRFVHSVRFIGGAHNKDAALAMARKALELGKIK